MMKLLSFLLMKVVCFIWLMLSIYLLLAGISLFFNISKKFNSFSLKLSGYDSIKSVRSITFIAIDMLILGVYGVISASIIFFFNDYLSNNFKLALAVIYFIVRLLDTIILSRLKEE
jgi:hypothetical protein